MPDGQNAGPKTMPDPAPHHEEVGPRPGPTAVRRGAIPILLGVVCLIVAVPASEDLDPLLRWVGAILIVLGLVIVVATWRTLAARD